MSGWVIDFKPLLVAVIENLLDDKRRDIHVARLNFYHDASVNFRQYLAYKTKNFFKGESDAVDALLQFWLRG